MKIDFVSDQVSSKEDIYLIKDNIFAVFDGFNSLDKFTDKDGRPGGLIAATIAKNVFFQNKGMLKNLAVETNAKIKDKMLDLGTNLRDKSSLWGTIMAVVRIENNFFDWMQISDSLILVIYKDSSYKLLVEDYDHDRDLLKIWKELAGQKKENIRELIDKPHRELRSKVNKEYGVLNGEEKIIQFIKTGRENLQNVKHILIFTDGLILPKEDPAEEDDWDTFVKLFLKGGLENIKNFVRNLEKDDPKCWKYPRYKQYDGIAGISISF